MKNNIYQHKQLQERRGASLALTSSAPAKSDVISETKLSVACRSENTPGIRTNKGKTGQLCGEDRGKFRYKDVLNKRQTCCSVFWISKQFKTRSVLSPPQGNPCGSRQH